jgi:hypothetical protein
MTNPASGQGKPFDTEPAKEGASNPPLRASYLFNASYIPCSAPARHLACRRLKWAAALRYGDSMMKKELVGPIPLV